MSFSGPVVLTHHGVLCSICTDHPETPLQYLPLCAAMAMRSGLTRQEALAAITIQPARIAGLDKQIGSLEVGKDADLAVLNPEKQTIYDENQIKTKVKNSVYKDMCLQGTVERTFLRGAEAGGSKPRGRYICR